MALEAARDCPGLTSGLIVDGTGDDGIFADFEEATSAFPGTPIGDESLGTPMLYSSGTTGRPKGIVRPLDDIPPGDQLPVFSFLSRLWQYRDGLTYLSPAPLYHSAPQAAVNLAIRHGGTVVIMEKFDPEQYLRLVERYRRDAQPARPDDVQPDAETARTGAQPVRPVLARDRRPRRRSVPGTGQAADDRLVGTGPAGVLRLDRGRRLLGLRQRRMARPSRHRRQGSARRAAHPGRVLRAVPPGTPGTLWFKPGSPFRYFNDVEKTAESTSPDGSMVTVGDVGYLDGDGYLYLTDRATFMIISGGVNIYPQECENLLITHPKVADAAVFGVPNEDLGEEVKAVVQLMPAVDPGPDTAAELIAFCREHLAHLQVPPVGRLHQPAAPAPDRQALQKASPRQLLGPIPQPHRVTPRPARCQDSWLPSAP